MTLTVVVVCLLVYAAQYQSDRRVEAHAEYVCAQLRNAEDTSAGEPYRWGRWSLSCEEALLHIYFDSDPQTHLGWHVDYMAFRGDAVGAERLRNAYKSFAERAPGLL